MRLFVNQIEGSGLSQDGRQETAELTQKFNLLTQVDAVFSEPLEYGIKAQMADTIVELEGHLSTVVKLSCSRCLNQYYHALDIDFVAAMVKQEDFHKDAPVDEDGVELDADSLGLSTYSGDEINLEELFYEQIVLALPARPLCSTECKGLCLHCGTDLNSTTCNCNPESFNNKFGALKGLKID